MNGLDAAIALLLVAGAAGGWRVGFVARVGAWIGLMAGLLVGLAALGPAFELIGAGTQDAFIVTLGVLGFAGLGGQILGGALGSLLSVHVPPELRRADRWGGLALGVLSAVVVLWLLAPVMRTSTGWIGDLADGSAVMSWSEDALPEPPDAIEAVELLIGADRYPSVFDREVAPPDVGPPPVDVALQPGVTALVEQATVRVLGDACGRTQQGSGALVAEGLVITNAHVVSGVADGSVRVERFGSALQATVVAWDPDADLAVLAVPGLTGRPLLLAEGREGDEVVAAGFAGGGPLALAPGRVGAVVRASGRDIYDEHRVVRDVLVLAAAIERGDSGGPVVRGDGALVGVVFALSPDHADVGYALDVDAVRAAIGTAGSVSTSTGSCIG